MMMPHENDDDNDNDKDDNGDDDHDDDDDAKNIGDDCIDWPGWARAGTCQPQYLARQLWLLMKMLFQVHIDQENSDLVNWIIFALLGKLEIRKDLVPLMIQNISIIDQ